MNTQKNKWVRRVLTDEELVEQFALKAKLKFAELNLRDARTFWRLWVIDRDNGKLTTHAKYNEGARYRREVSRRRRELRVAQENYYLWVTAVPVPEGEAGLAVECPFSHMQEERLSHLVAAEAFALLGAGGDELRKAQHNYLVASGWRREPPYQGMPPEAEARYRYLANHPMLMARALHVERQRTRSMADPALLESMHVAEQQMLRDCGWEEVGADAWVDAAQPEREPKTFGHATNTVDANNVEFSARKQATRQAVLDARRAYLIGNGWVEAGNSHYVDPTTGREYAFKKAVNRQKYFTHNKRVMRGAATPEERAVVSELMRAEDQYLLDRGWVRLTRCRYQARTFSARFRPEAVQLQLAIDEDAGVTHDAFRGVQVKYLEEHGWRPAASGGWKLSKGHGSGRRLPLGKAVAFQQFMQWQWNRLVGGTQ